MGRLSWITWSNVITRVLISGRHKFQRGNVMVEAEMGEMHFEGGARDHQPRNAGNF